MYTLTAENKYGERLELTHNPCYDITEIDGLYPPEAVINSTKTAGMDGAVFNSAYMNSSTITITLMVKKTEYSCIDISKQNIRCGCITKTASGMCILTDMYLRFRLNILTKSKRCR